LFQDLSLIGITTVILKLRESAKYIALGDKIAILMHPRYKRGRFKTTEGLSKKIVISTEATRSVPKELLRRRDLLGKVNRKIDLALLSLRVLGCVALRSK